MARALWHHRFSQRGDQSPLRLLVIQATPFCNIDCGYCYLPARTNKARVGIDTVAKLFERVTEEKLASEHLTILWHAGEPLAVPLAFYAQAYALAERALPQHCRFRFNFQTNGILITEDFCEFVLRTGAHVGVSIDGPKELTDRWRVYRNGSGVYDAVMRGIEKLRRHGIPFSVLGVLTREALSQPDEIFDFVVGLGASEVGFNIEEVEAVHTVSSLSRSPELVAELQHFLRRLVARIDAENPVIRFRDLEQLEAGIKWGTEVFSRVNNPFSIITMTYTGEISTFAPEMAQDPAFAFGNVATHRFEDLLEEPKFKAAYAGIEAGKAACRSECGYFSICGGGCPSNKWSENGTLQSTETMHCLLTKKAPSDVLLETLEARYLSASAPPTGAAP